MKMVKSLLLGTAAGLVAIAGAQAADLPVKAKPVQYVKICSLYGAGFYYIPGTDMCLKIGGYVRAEYAYNVNGSSTTTQIGEVNNRGTNNSWWRNRGYITADARNQTEYGTVRSYIAVGLSTNTTGGDNAANQFDANRAMIQFAGFTAGRTQSFFDFYSSAAAGYVGLFPAADTGDAGVFVTAYTAQFGNGLSASVSAEMRRMTQLVNASAALGGAGGVGAAVGQLSGNSFSATGNTSTAFGAYGGFNVPDVIANLRVDQAWGSAQVMGALHEVNATYYANASAPNSAVTGIENNGHPNDKYGFAVGGGVKLLAPMIGQGDYLDTQVTYTQGASRYIFQNPGSGNWYIQHGQQAAFGLLSDGVYGGSVVGGTASNIELTTAWSVNAHYEHFWNKSWQTALYGGYAEVSYDGAANAMLCSAQGFGNGAGGTAAVATAGCDNNWKTWWAGLRTQWNIDSQTYLGLDIAYLNVTGMSTPTGLLGTGFTAAQTTIPNTTATTAIATTTEDQFMGRVRIHRNFYP